MKFNDAEDLADMDETPDDVHPASSMGCIMLVFRIAHPDFGPGGPFLKVFVMRPARRHQ